jgi:tetratricopeptide (TPR) repeat protein
MTLSSRTVSAVLLLACALLFARVVSAVETPPAVPAKEIFDLVQQGRAALEAEKPADALKMLEKAIAKPGFSNADPAIQYFALLVASYAAQGTDDNARAHELLVAATRFPDADAELWTRRAGTAAAIGQWEDAAQSLTIVAKKWPKELVGDEYHNWLVNKTSRELGKKPNLQQTRIDLLNALFEAGYKMKYGIEPSHLWLVVATDALERQDLKRAREVAQRITDSSTLISMRIDKRFDALTSAEPKMFDVQAAAEREARQLKSAVKDNPKSLGAVVQHGYAMYTLGQFEDLLALANATITKVDKSSPKDPPYEDLDDSLNWIYNHKANALRALGRRDEAAAALAAWEASDRNHDDKVSQAINLGFFYNEMGRPEEALKAVAQLQVGKDMSEYGSTQFQYVRFQAYQQLGKATEAQEIVAWMREHRADSRETAQGTLLEAGDADGAAALLLDRLNDANERAATLASIQTYAQTPRTERQQKLDALNETLLARADVAAAIAKYGRREKFPTYSLEY